MSNRIHPTAVIGARVRIGTGNTIGAFAVIEGDVEIGDDNWIGVGVVIGAPPEVRSFPHPATAEEDFGAGVRIGSRNTIREYAQIHSGWKAPTVVGDGAFIMNQVYIGHDGRIGDGATLASSVLLGGHVTVGAGANLGLGASVHQFRVVGVGAMVGMGAVVTRDVPPFAKSFGSPSRVNGANTVGLERRGVHADTVRAVAQAFSDGHEPDFDALDVPADLRAQLSAE